MHNTPLSPRVSQQEEQRGPHNTNPVGSSEIRSRFTEPQQRRPR